MLCLREQIGGDPARVAFGGQNDRFRGASREINGAIAADQLFGGGDIFIAGSKDFFYERNRVCFISERGDRLRSANTGDLFDTEEVRCCQQLGMWPWANGNDMRNSGNLRRDRCHDERGYERKSAARDVATNRFDGGNVLADFNPRFSLDTPRTRKLLFSDAADVFQSSLNGLQEIRAHLGFCGADFFS